MYVVVKVGIDGSLVNVAKTESRELAEQIREREIRKGFDAYVFGDISVYDTILKRLNEIEKDWVDIKNSISIQTQSKRRGRRKKQGDEE